MDKSTIITLDFEASGINENSYPIEVGISLADGKTWCSLIKPSEAWHHWDQKAEKVHGISRDDLFHHGKPAKEVAEYLNRLLEDSMVYSDCWVLDQPWLARLYESARLSPSFRLTDMMHIMDEDNYNKLLDTKKAIADDLDLTRHRASNDALVLQLAYKQLN